MQMYRALWGEKIPSLFKKVDTNRINLFSKWQQARKKGHFLLTKTRDYVCFISKRNLGARKD